MDLTTNEQPTYDINYREEVLRLAKEGKMSHTLKYIEKADDEKVEKIYHDYQENNLMKPMKKFLNFN